MNSLNDKLAVDGNTVAEIRNSVLDSIKHWYCINKTEWDVPPDVDSLRPLAAIIYDVLSDIADSE
jgi:hypothetical protein